MSTTNPGKWGDQLPFAVACMAKLYRQALPLCTKSSVPVTQTDSEHEFAASGKLLVTEDDSL